MTTESQTTQDAINQENATRTAMGGQMTTAILRGQIEKYGAVYVTSDNLEFAGEIERNEFLRLRRLGRDMDVSELPQIGDVLVRQYGKVG